MSILDIQRDLQSGVKYPRFVNRQALSYVANKLKPYTLIVLSDVPDTCNIEITVDSASDVYKLSLSYFELRSGQLVAVGKISTEQRVLNTVKELKAGIPVLIHIESNVQITGKIKVTVSNYTTRSRANIYS